MPIDQQLQDLQQTIETAKLKLKLAEAQFSTLESLSKQLATAQKDAAATFSRTQVDIAADISATRSSIEGSTFLPNGAGISAAAVPAAVPEASIYGLDGGSRGGDVQAAYEAAAANIGTVDSASVPYGGGSLADAAGAADTAAAALQATTLLSLIHI